MYQVPESTLVRSEGWTMSDRRCNTVVLISGAKRRQISTVHSVPAKVVQAGSKAQTGRTSSATTRHSIELETWYRDRMVLAGRTGASVTSLPGSGDRAGV